MIAEIILIVAIIGIFVLVVRRIPEAWKQKDSLETVPVSPKAKVSLMAKLINLFTKKSTPKKSETITLEDKKLSNQEQRAALLSDESLLKEGDGYLHAGKLKEAERAFLRGVAKNPKNPKLYNRLGAIYLKQRNYRDALEAFTAARDFDSSRASRHYNVALAAWHLKRRSQAREAIARAITLDPNSVKYQELSLQINED